MISVTETLRSWTVLEVVSDRRTQAGVGVLAFVLATSFGAQVAVPWTPVPMTLQPLFVILAGAVLGPRLGAAAMAMYVVVGAAGAPVFSNGGFGLPWLFGPTGGYLLATPAAAFVVGSMMTRASGIVRSLAALSLGVLTMYVGGVSQLLLISGQSLGAVLALGVLPFLAGDVTKILVALALTRTMRHTSLGQS